MGREKSTEIFSFEAEKCPCSLFLHEKSDCCHDSSEILIIDDSQAQTLAFTPSVPKFFEIGPLYSDVEDNKIIEQSIIQFINPDASPPPKDPLYQTYCSLVFYDSEWS